jgi:hypothetical protein
VWERTVGTQWSVARLVSPIATKQTTSKGEHSMLSVKDSAAAGNGGLQSGVLYARHLLGGRAAL